MSFGPHFVVDAIQSGAAEVLSPKPNKKGTYRWGPSLVKITEQLCCQVFGTTLLRDTLAMATIKHVGVWRSLVARVVRDDEALGSSPSTPTSPFRPGGDSAKLW